MGVLRIQQLTLSNMLVSITEIAVHLLLGQVIVCGQVRHLGI